MAQSADDSIICAFGPDYFRGARFGSAFGAMFSALLCRQAYKRLCRDQSEVDFDLGIRHGQRNPNFSSWRIARGLRTQPMLTLACLSTATTALLKSMKCYLAHRRCIEFDMDDADFETLRHLSHLDPEAGAFYASLQQSNVENANTVQARQERQAASASVPDTQPLYSTASTAGRGTVCTSHRQPERSCDTETLTELPSVKVRKLSLHDRDAHVQTSNEILLDGKPIRRGVVDTLTDRKMDGWGGGNTYASSCSRPLPTFGDGMAVGLLGSIMDCHVPQKALPAYYNKKFGMG